MGMMARCAGLEPGRSPGTGRSEDYTRRIHGMRLHGMDYTAKDYTAVGLASAVRVHVSSPQDKGGLGVGVNSGGPKGPECFGES